MSVRPLSDLESPLFSPIRYPLLPIGFPAVLHGHWHYSPRYRRVFYLYRDGRDVVVSQYFRALGEIRHPHYASLPAYYRRHFPCLFDAGQDPDDIRLLLPRFIEEWARRPVSTRISWSKHIAEWAFGRPNVVALTYCDLLKDPVAALARALPVHSREAIDLERLEASVRKFSFEKQTGRPRGSELRGAIIRKGIAGDWQQHFTREAGRVFDRHFGDMLIRLDYERDRSWLEKLD